MSLLKKANIITTPTAYSEGKLHSVKPNVVLGDELISSFTNGTTYPLDTFVSSGNNITSLIKSSGFAGCASNGNTFVSGDKIKVSFSYTKNSGDDLRVVFSSLVTGAGMQISNAETISSSGEYSFTFTITSSATGYLQFGTGNASHSINASITNVSVKEDISADFDFTRGSTATRVNEAGLIESVAANIPRINYENGQGHLLLEGQRTNLIPYSESFSTDWSRNQTDVDVNDVISPDGTQNADFLFENTANTPHFMFQVVGTTSTSDYTISIFAKHNNRILQIFAGGGDISGNPYANFDLEDGVFNNNGCNDAFIEDYGNGWYRCGVVVTSAVTSGFNPCFGLVDTLGSSRAAAYAGDGTSGIYIYGAQIEQGSYSTSYIVSNSGSATTRLAETCTNAGNSDIIPSDEGVLYAEMAALSDDATNRRVTLSDGTATNRMYVSYKNYTNQIRVEVVSAGVSVFDSTYSSIDITQFSKIALAYKSNDFALWVNGTEVYTDSSGSTPIGLDRLNFDNGLGNEPFYGKTRMVAVFPYLSNDELETLTSWMSFSDMAIDLNYTIQ